MPNLATARTIPSLLAERAVLGSHPAIVSGGTRVSYSELRERVREVARAYIAAGIRRGDRIAIWAPNGLEFILALFGAQDIGASVVPLNTRYTGHEAADILNRSGSSILVFTNSFLDRDFACLLREAINAGAPQPEHLRLLVDVDAAPDTGALPWDEFLKTGANVTEAELAAAEAAVTPDDIADILYTSGTTGVAKGVMTAQRQTIGVAYAWALGADLNGHDRFAILNPLFHGFGYKASLVSSVVAGATIYPVSLFDATSVLELIERERITVMPGVPTHFMTLMDHPRLREYDISSLRFAVAGATASPDSLFHDMVNVLGFERVAQAYGLTECVVTTMSRKEDPLAHVAQTTGPAVANTEICLVDDAGKPVPAGHPGEILIRGDNVMLGYFNDEDATRAAIDADGWLHTGDIGEFDEHGCVKITGRKKDMFIVGGFNVYPAEVENTLRHHPAVNESAVIGVHDNRLGAVGRAYVSLFSDANPKPTAEELIEFCRARLANFKVPRSVVFVDEFPRTATGKIKKAELEAPAAA